MSELDVIVIHIRAGQAADPGFQEFNGSPTRVSRRIRWCTADRCCTPSDQRLHWVGLS